MLVKPSWKYQAQFAFVRKTNVYLNEVQQSKLSQALTVENQLYDFALSYLNKTYGYKHLDRKVPTAMAKRYLVNWIKALFVAEKYGLKVWSYRKLGLSSHNAQLFLVQLVTNFTQYKKQLVQVAHKMNEQDRFNFRMNMQTTKHGRHTNSKHKAWYRIGALGFRAQNRTILIDLQPDTGLKVLSMHKLKIPDYGIVEIQGNAFEMCSNDIHQVKLKWQHDHTYQLQFVHIQDKPAPVLAGKKAAGLDWNMTKNVFYQRSDGKSFQIPGNVMSKADKYEQETNRLKSRRDLRLSNRRKLNKKIQRLSAKRAQLLTETYRRGVAKVVQGYDVLVVERLSTKDMRRLGRGKGINRGFNRKLSLIKPFELQQILANYAWHHGMVMLQTDAFMTTQTEFGTNYHTYHPESERKFPSHFNSQVMIDRDTNAAKNILDWGLHPDHHMKVRMFKKVTPAMVSDVM